jgi:hypothetical protein
VVGALQHESLRLVADIVESPPPLPLYTVLKDRLMASHVLSGYRRAEQLFNMPPLGSRKPSALMAAMLEVCPGGEEKTELFAFQFLQRLPRELRVLLAKVDKKDPQGAGGPSGRAVGPTRLCHRRHRPSAVRIAVRGRHGRRR